MSNAKRAKGGSRQPRSGRRRRRRASQSAAPSAHAQARALDQAPAIDLPKVAPAAPEIVSPADDRAAAAPASTGTPAAPELPALDDADQVSAAPQQDERLARRAVLDSALAVPAPRAARRTRTLADVMRRARPAPTRPEEDADDSNPRGDQPHEMWSLPLQAAAGESAERSGSALNGLGE
ncbi:MAG TPA: hypothetical protein VKC57_01785, partial [Ktedonobacterales bacterium]|nr:hypothetical protein [Ktedonobacterales bacterium]